MGEPEHQAVENRGVEPISINNQTIIDMREKEIKQHTWEDPSVCKMEAISSITILPKGEISELLCTEFTLHVSRNMDREAYLKDGKPTKDGCHALTNIFVQGLLGNLHFAHQEGLRDSAEHLRYIMSELDRGFVRLAKVEQGVMEIIGGAKDLGFYTNSENDAMEIPIDPVNDTMFFDSPDAGENCKCSRCGKAIIKAPVIRGFPPTNSKAQVEFRYHPECLGFKAAEDYGDQFDTNFKP